MRTPWGTAQTVNKLAAGIAEVTTAGHGGIHLAAAHNAKVHEAWRVKGGWYEEDSEWAIVGVTYPHLFTETRRVDAHRSTKDWYPDEYERVFGVKLLPDESYTLRERAFYEVNADRYLVTAAWGYRNNRQGRIDVPEGMVGVVARIGGHHKPRGEERWFLVPEHEYAKRGGWSFVVDESRHAAWPEAAPPAHELRLVQSSKYAHLVNPQCVCGWSASGSVSRAIAQPFYDRHLPVAA